MSVLLGYLASLILTFVVTVMTPTAFLVSQVQIHIRDIKDFYQNITLYYLINAVIT